MRIAAAWLVIVMGPWLGARAWAAEALPASEPAVEEPAPASAPAQDEIPPEVLAFFTSPGVAATLVVAVDHVARQLAVGQGALAGCTTGCILGAAAPIALGLVSPLVGGPRFEFAEIGGPIWAALPGAAIGAGLLAPLWATAEGLRYEHQRGSFIGLAFPSVEDQVPAAVYRDAATAAVLGVVAAAMPIAAGVALLNLGGSGPVSGWHLASIPLFASAVLVAPTVTSALYPERVTRHDPYVQASQEVREDEVARLVEMLTQLIEEEEARAQPEGQDEAGTPAEVP